MIQFLAALIAGAGQRLHLHRPLYRNRVMTMWDYELCRCGDERMTALTSSRAGDQRVIWSTGWGTPEVVRALRQSFSQASSQSFEVDPE